MTCGSWGPRGSPDPATLRAPPHPEPPNTPWMLRGPRRFASARKSCETRGARRGETGASHRPDLHRASPPHRHTAGEDPAEGRTPSRGRTAFRVASMTTRMNPTGRERLEGATSRTCTKPPARRRRAASTSVGRIAARRSRRPPARGEDRAQRDPQRLTRAGGRRLRLATIHRTEDEKARRRRARAPRLRVTATATSRAAATY